MLYLLFCCHNVNFKPLAKGKADSDCVNYWTFATELRVHSGFPNKTGTESLVKHISWIGTGNVLALRVTYYLTMLLSPNFPLIFLDCLEPLTKHIKIFPSLKTGTELDYYHQKLSVLPQTRGKHEVASWFAARLKTYEIS